MGKCDICNYITIETGARIVIEIKYYKSQPILVNENKGERQMI